MELRSLGNGRAKLPVVGLGTWKVLDVRGAEAEARARSVVEEAFRAGVRVFDSSPMYGEAERVLGAAIAPHRDEAFIATKVWATTPAEAEAQIARSLAFFGGRIDLYQVHNLRQLGYVLPRLRQLRRDGSVRYIGVTHYDPAAFPEMARVLREEDLDTVQLPLNVNARGSEAELLPLAAERGLGVLVMQPLATGALIRGRAEDPPPASAQASEARTRAQALLKWVLSDRRVSVVLAATGTPGHATENVRAGEPPWFPEGVRTDLGRQLGA